MTIPWMMNCAHEERGWCLDCVVKLGEENARRREMLEEAEKAAAEAALALARVEKALAVTRREADGALHLLYETAQLIEAGIVETTELGNRRRSAALLTLRGAMLDLDPVRETGSLRMRGVFDTTKTLFDLKLALSALRALALGVASTSGPFADEAAKLLLSVRDYPLGTMLERQTRSLLESLSSPKLTQEWFDGEIALINFVFAARKLWNEERERSTNENA